MPEDERFQLLKVYTDEGIVGVGEAFRGHDVSREAEELVGKNPFALNLRSMRVPFHDALYDVIGKALGVPAYRLLGDKVRDKVPVAYWSCHMEPEETAREAEHAAKRGFKVHKLKARSWDIVETARLITGAAGPDYAIRVDPNGEFKLPSTTIRLAEELEGYTIECFEDPIPKENPNLLHEFALLREKCSIPIAPHFGDPEQVLYAIRTDAADCFDISGRTEGFDKVLACAAIAEAAGIPIWLQTAANSLGVRAAFSVHLNAVIKNATMPDDTLHFLRENDLVGGMLDVQNGFIEVPERPGLGIELDEKAVARYRIG